jgi:hypothetical protein
VPRASHIILSAHHAIGTMRRAQRAEALSNSGKLLPLLTPDEWPALMQTDFEETGGAESYFRHYLSTPCPDANECLLRKISPKRTSRVEAARRGAAHADGRMKGNSSASPIARGLGMELTRIRQLPDQLIGYRLFTNRARRPVFQQDDGWQYVIDDDGNKEYGLWLIPEDEPSIIVQGQDQPGAPR